MRKHFLSLVGSSLLAASVVAPAQAFTFTFGESSQSSNSPATGASAFVDFIFTQDGNDVLLQLDIENTTDETNFGAGADESKLTGIAFDLIGGINLTDFTGGTYLDTLLTDVNFTPFSNSVGNFDVAAADNNNFEGGNANGALPQGLSDTVSFKFSSVFSGTSLVASEIENLFFSGFESGNLDIAARFQQVNAGEGSDKLLGGTLTRPPEPPKPQPVPEPAAMAGLLAVGAGIVVNRRKKAQEA